MYTDILKGLDPKPWIGAWQSGSFLTDALSEARRPPDWYGCPPGLIPLASDGSGPIYIGVWVRWFEEPRRHTYVMCSVENGHLLREIARTDEQFSVWLTLRAIAFEGAITDEIVTFCKETGPLSVSDIEAHARAFGDDPERLTDLPMFRDQRPNDIGPEAVATYGVLHPQHTDPARFRDACWFELSEEQQRIALDHPDAAPWLRRDAPVARLFDDYLSSGRQAEAWATLNSTGWSLPDARAAAERLAATTDLPGLALQLRAWIAFSQQTDIPERYGY